MKIRRTLPSVNQYSPMNRRLSMHNVSKKEDKQFVAIQNLNYQTLKKISSSPEKRIFGLERSSSKSNKQYEDFQRKKTVSFIEPVVHQIDLLKQPSAKPERSPKKQRRSKIFINENKIKNNDQVISTSLSLKWLSQQLKKSSNSEVQQKLTKKIAQLEDKVNGMSEKVSVSEVHQIKKSEGSHFRNYSEIDNNVLRLQLEQMRRCEKIAKENEVLYSKLIKNIEINENSLVNSRKRANSQYQLSSQSHAISLQNEKGRISAKITVFEDFQQYQKKNLMRDLDESEGQLEITSPFYLQENRGKMKFSK